MRQDCRSCPVRNQGLCASVPDRQLEALEAIKGSERLLRAGIAVFAEGDAGNNVYIVKKGWAIAYAALEDGRRQILRFVLPGSLIGFETAADGTMPCTTEALTDLIVCPLPRRDLLRLCERIPQLALCLAARLATETISDWRLLGGLGTCSAVERIARLILALYSRLSNQDATGQTEISLPISQGLIADATGLTTVHVCRMLKDMRNAGLLTFTRGHLRVIDLARLADMAQMGDMVPPQTPGGPCPPSPGHEIFRPKPCRSGRPIIECGANAGVPSVETSAPLLYTLKESS